MLPLSMTQSGDTICIKQIKGKDDARRHLENLGFLVGEDVTVITKLAGNLILNVKGSRIALDKMMANRIMV